MDQDLMKWFCYLPVITNRELKWIPEASLERNLEKVLKSKSGLSLEQTLMIFLQQSRSCSCGLSLRHLQAYLYKDAARAAKDFYYNYESRLTFLSLEDIYQEAFIIATKLALLLASNERIVDYLYNDIKHKIRDRVFQLLSWKSSDKSKKHWKLRNASEKTLKQALKFSGYTNLGLESHLLAWQCFKEVYAPARGEDHNPPILEQLQQMAELYLNLQKRRSPELKQDNLEINAEFIRQCLENCIQALYEYDSRPHELSLDRNLGSEDSRETTLQVDDDRENRKLESLEIQNSLTEFYQKLDDEQRNLVVLHSGCGFTTREIADLDVYDCHYSTISRKLDSIKELWLYEWYEKNRGDGKPGFIEEVMRDSSRRKPVKKLVDEVWKKHESDSYWLVFRVFQKALQHLELSSQAILGELQVRKNQAPELNLTAVEKEKVQVLVRGIIQRLEAELEIALTPYETLNQKISDLLINQFLPRIY